MNIGQYIPAKVDNLVKFMRSFDELFLQFIILFFPVFPEAVAASLNIRWRVPTQIRQSAILPGRPQINVLAADR